jgi:ribose transport system permease protein
MVEDNYTEPANWRARLRQTTEPVRRQAGVLALLALIAATWAAFASVNSSFVGSFNLYGVGQVAARDAVLGMAQTLSIAVARMNLAIGSIGAVCSSLLGFLLVSGALPLPAALVCVCVVAVFASLLMGLVELFTGIHAFVVTLGFLAVYTGGALLLTKGNQYLITSSVLTRFGNGSFLSAYVCPVVPMAIVCGVVLWFVYNWTSLGREMLAVGGNVYAARVSGIKVARVVLACYVLSGLFVAAAAVMQSSFQLDVNADVGSDWLLPSFIAPVLGGVALIGGSVSIGGILLAATFYDSLQSGLTILNVPTYWLDVTQGAVLLLAVIVSQRRRAHRGRSRRPLLRASPPTAEEAVPPTFGEAVG